MKDSVTDWLLGYPTVLKELGDVNGKTVIDFGCGSGQFTRHIARTYPLARVIGVDTSEKAIAQSQAATEDSIGVQFIQIEKESEIGVYEPDAICMKF